MGRRAPLGQRTHGVGVVSGPPVVTFGLPPPNEGQRN